MWWTAIVAWLGHNLARTIGVLVISSLLIGVPMAAYKNFHDKIYNEGYQKGYSQAMTDHPQVINGDYYAGEKLPFFLFKLWKLRLGI